MTLVSERGTETVPCGLCGQWPEGPYGYFLSPKDPDNIPDTIHNLGYSGHLTMYSGGFTSPDTFVFYMRSQSLLPSYRYTVKFYGDYLEIHMGPETVIPSPGAPGGPQAEVIIRGVNENL